MILQDELVRVSLFVEGQGLIVEPDDVVLDDDSIYQIFQRVLGEYTRFRPFVKTLDVEIGSDGIPKPSDFLWLITLRRRGITVTDLGAGIFYRRTPSEFFTSEESSTKIESLPGIYRMEYASPYLIITDVPVYVAYVPKGTETTIEFKLPARPVAQTVTLTRGTQSVTDDGAGHFPAGGFLTAESDIGYQTRVITLHVTAGTDPINATYKPKNPGVQQLSFKDEYFVKKFSAEFLASFATVKSLMTVEGTPFDLNRDALLEHARSVREALKVLETTDKKWWVW